jgi:hypothetical protein
MKRLMRVLKILVQCLGVLALLAVALFCVFGFLASFEPGNGLPWKLGYGVLGCSCLTGAVALLRRPLPLTVAALALVAVALISVSDFEMPWLLGFGALGYGGLIGTAAWLRRPLAPTLIGSTLLAVTLFSIFGFMESSFSQPGQVGYATLGCICLFFAVVLLGWKKESYKTVRTESRVESDDSSPTNQSQT